MSLIVAENLTKDYQVGEVIVPAIRGVSFEIAPASFVSFIGPSGSGKTTLLNMIGCIDAPTSGKLRVAGTNTIGLDRKQSAAFRGANIGFIFQDFNLIPVLSARENIEYPLLMVKHIPPAERTRRVSELLEAVGMKEQADKRPDQLSGGQKQRIAIRNLLRYRRRTVLTASLVAIGVIFVLVFSAASGSFKSLMIGQITDSLMGHLQIHKKGYVSSIENLPLNLGMPGKTFVKVDEILKNSKDVESSSPRIKFGALFSNFVESTNIRLNGVYPEREFKTVPLLPSRISKGSKSIKKGEILIPALLEKGMKVKIGDSICYHRQKIRPKSPDKIMPERSQETAPDPGAKCADKIRDSL